MSNFFSNFHSIPRGFLLPLQTITPSPPTDMCLFWFSEMLYFSNSLLCEFWTAQPQNMFRPQWFIDNVGKIAVFFFLRFFSSDLSRLHCVLKSVLQGRKPWRFSEPQIIYMSGLIGSSVGAFHTSCWPDLIRKADEVLRNWPMVSLCQFSEAATWVPIWLLPVSQSAFLLYIILSLPYILHHTYHCLHHSIPANQQ